MRRFFFTKNKVVNLLFNGDSIYNEYIKKISKGLERVIFGADK